MLDKISIRWRLTFLSATLLSLCCILLTIILNVSAFEMAEKINAMPLTPAISYPLSEEGAIISTPAQSTKEAKKGFRSQSMFYMIWIILSGSALTYYLSGKALKPLDDLNEQVKKRNIHNLAEAYNIPTTNDEIADLAQSFQEMSDKLQDAFETQKRFSASAAHELRTPLAVLQTKIDVFKKRAKHDEADYEAMILVFEKQTKRLRSLVGNLLDMSNMDDDREQSKISMQDVMQECIAELSQIASDKKIDLSLTCDDSIVIGNIDLLYRAFYNLIENGIKYQEEGGYVNIEVKTLFNHQVEVLIYDHGFGIPDDMKMHIFEPFYRVDASRSRTMGGAGLGLSIVKRVLNVHDGCIEVLDHEQGGTCFQIHLNCKTSTSA